jgi:prepilin-type N-terminal cleavage/methylation domain-containing protein
MNETKLIVAKPQQGGYTLVELAIAIAILAVLIVAGLSGVQGILTSSKVNDQIKTVAKLSSKVSGNFMSGGTSGISTSGLAGLGAWDSSRVKSGAVTSSFGTSEFAKSNKSQISDLPATNGFIYVISKVPAAACSDLATGISNIVYGIRIQKTAITAEIEEYPATAADSVIEIKSAGGSISNIELAKGCAIGTTVEFVIVMKP